MRKMPTRGSGNGSLVPMADKALQQLPIGQVGLTAGERRHAKMVNYLSHLAAGHVFPRVGIVEPLLN